MTECQYVHPKKCKMIQWGKVHLRDGELACPECGEPAELCLGFFGNPCYAHVPKNRTNQGEAA